MTPEIQSITAKLLTLAKQKRLPYERLFTHFMLERIVYRLASDPVLEKHLVFKGGFVCVRVYDSSRFTVDIDTALYGLEKNTAIEKIKSRMTDHFLDHVWFRYESSVSLTMQGDYGGERLIYKGGLGDEIPSKGKYQTFHLDIGIGDPITPAPIHAETACILGDGNISWNIYTPETILAEKLHTVIVKGRENSRSKDIYDIHFFLPKVDPEILKKAITTTFSYRGDQMPNNFGSALSNLDTEILRLGWTRSVGSIINAKSFDETFFEIMEYVKKLGI